MGQVEIGEVSAPEKLSPAQDLSQFRCGEPELDDWLKRRALHNEESGASRSYVVCIGRQVVGYYALSAGAAAHRDAPGRVPVMVIGRLAIDLKFQGRGIGTALLKDAVLRTVQAAEIAGIRAILVHAISESAKRFYQKLGFMESPTNPMTMMITVQAAADTLAKKL
jgi:GNAT superfamily N-acetyltransferase